MIKLPQNILWLLIVIAIVLTGCRAAAMEETSPSPLSATETPDIAALQPTAATQEIITPDATATPHFSVALNPAYTESNPLKDTQQILEILEELRQLELNSVTEPGWYLQHAIYDLDLADEDDRSNLVHVVDRNWNCLEQMTFFRKDGQIVPFQFVSADGNFGGFDDKNEKFISLNYLYKNPITCNLIDPEDPGMASDYILSYNLSEFKRTLELMTQQPQFGNIEFKAWFSHENPRDMFVVQQNSSGPTGGTVMDPDTKAFQEIMAMKRWDVYDLPSGRLLLNGEELKLGNGKILHNETQFTLIYYLELPEDLQAAYDQAVAGLDALKK
jgi:hypothetical protein